MNILFHCWEYPPRGSGIGRYVFHMAKALREAGCFTVIVTSHGDEGPSDTLLEHGIVYRVYPVHDIGKAELAEVVLRIAKKHDIHWIEGADHLGESSHLLAVRHRPPVVIKAHYNDVLRVARYAHVHYPWQKPLVDIACFRERKRLVRERYSLAHADLLIAPSERILEEMKKQKIPLAARQAVVPNPISPVADWLNREAASPTLLLVGRIDMGKGIEYLPGLVRQLKPRFPDISVEIAGGDGYARFLGSTKAWLVKRMGDCQDSLKFLGMLDQHALDEAYSRAWVVIIPSNWDTFPTVALEAMIRGKAIVASQHGGMPEMLTGTSCRIADPASLDFSRAVADFLADKALRDTAGGSGRARAESAYAPARIAETHVKILQTCK
jgi:glycosyltransferase involved in cell wall biosynthesis